MLREIIRYGILESGKSGWHRAKILYSISGWERQNPWHLLGAGLSWAVIQVAHSMIKHIGR